MVTRNEELNWDYLLSPEFELINSAGKPLTGGYIEVYIAGTRNKYYCASDFNGTLHPFQIPLDALGSNIILADPTNAYDVYVYNKYGSLVMSRYNVHCQGGNGGSSTYIGDRLFYGQYRASNVTTVANLSKNKGNINLSSEGYLKLKEDMSYHITVRGSFQVDDVSNVDTTLNYIEYSSVNPIKVDVDYTKEGPQYFELSYDLYRLPEDMDYQVAFDESNGMVTDLIVEVHSLSNLSTPAQGGGVYDSGWGINITNNIISVDPSILEDYVTAEEVIAIVSGVTGLTPGSEYTAGDYISIVDNEISVTGINPEDYATHTEVYEATVTAVNTVTGLIPDSEEVEFEEINLSDYALASAIPVVTGFATHDEVHEATVTAIDTVTGLIPELPDEEEVEFEEIDLEDYALASAIPDVSDFTTHTEVHEAIVTAVNTVTSLIPDAQVQSDWAQETVTAVDFIKNKPDEIEIIAGQNIGLFEGEGTLTIAASAVDLSDYTTFEDVMEIVTGVTGLNDYGQFYATAVTGTAEMSRTKGTIALTNDGKLKLVKGSSYHITVRGRYDVATAVNTFTDVSYIEAITNTGIHVNVDNTITDSQYFELSYDLYKLNSDTDYTVSFSGLAGSINDLYLEIHSLDGIGGGGSGPVTGGGVEYDAGWGINILNNVISVDSSILNNYATKDELQDSIELVTGLIPQSQVQSDWAQETVTAVDFIKNKPQQVNLVAGQNIGITVTGANIVISASATDLSDYATIEQLQDSVELVTGLIPDVSDLVTDTELQSAISTVREEIPTIQLNANNQVTAINNYEIAGGSVTGTFVQVQSDWTEDNSSEPSYIQHKPEEVRLVAGDNVNITETATSVVISASGGGLEYTAGDYISIENDEISVTGVGNLVAGNNITITESGNNITISSEGGGSTYTAGQYISIDSNDVIAVTGLATKADLDTVSGLITPELPVVAGEGIGITETEGEITIAVTANFATQSDIAAVTGLIPTDNYVKVITDSSSTSQVTYGDLRALCEGHAEFDLFYDATYPYNRYIYRCSRAKQEGSHYEVCFSTDPISDVEEQSDDTYGKYSNKVYEIYFWFWKVRDDGPSDDTIAYVGSDNVPGVNNHNFGWRSIQADWNQTDSNAQTYIKNKPDLSTYATKTELTSVSGTLQTEIETVSATIPELPDEEEVEFETIDLSDYALASAIPDISNLATKAEVQTVSAAIPDTSDMATQTWVGEQGFLTSVPSNYVTETELTGAVSGFATKTELNGKQSTLTGITDIQVVNSLPGSPVATVLYLIPEV